MAHQLRLQVHPKKTHFHWNPEEVLAEALVERALFLENHPKYQAFQREIDALLEKAGNSENRMTVLAVLMEAKLIELHEQFKHLNAILVKAAAAHKPGSGSRMEFN